MINHPKVVLHCILRAIPYKTMKWSTVLHCILHAIPYKTMNCMKALVSNLLKHDHTPRFVSHPRYIFSSFKIAIRDFVFKRAIMCKYKWYAVPPRLRVHFSARVFLTKNLCTCDRAALSISASSIGTMILTSNVLNGGSSFWVLAFGRPTNRSRSRGHLHCLEDAQRKPL